MGTEKEQILITRKLTSLEYRLLKTGETVQEVVKATADSDIDGQSILASHFRQMSELDTLLKVVKVSPENVIAGTKLNRRLVRPASTVVAFGGDDYLKYVGYFLDRQVLVGFNSDYEGSNGQLTRFNAESMDHLAPRLEDRRFEVEQWPRLGASIDDRVLRPAAVSEIFVGVRDRLKTSKYYFDVREDHTRLANSGLIVATGAGSTGWIRSAASCKHEEAEGFSPAEERAKYFTTEAIFNRIYPRFAREGFIEPGEDIEMVYSGHLPAIVSFDSVNNFRLLRGQRAKVWISDKPLRVAIAG